jgi:hypothetical protein
MSRELKIGGLAMREHFEFAEFLASAWRLAHPGRDERMPTSHGILDQALYELRDELPEKLKDVLSFGNTRIGFRCYELPDILYCAQANLLTSSPNPTYLTTAVQIEEETARRILRRRNLDPKVGRDFGRKLTNAIEKAKNELGKPPIAAA